MNKRRMDRMITLKDAIRIAKERNNNFNAYQEYEDAYEFFVDDGEITAGGGGRCCIIEKADGKILPWAIYFMDADRSIVEIGEPVHI